MSDVIKTRIEPVTQPWRAQANPSLVRPELREAVRRSAVLSFLTRECLGLYVGTATAIERHWSLSAEDVSLLGIASAPTHTFNVIASAACADRFGDLGDIPGFYRCGVSWFIDMDERLAFGGIVLPVRDHQRPSLITGLRIFRHVRDERSFLLRVRAERIAA